MFAPSCFNWFHEGNYSLEDKLRCIWATCSEFRSFVLDEPSSNNDDFPKELEALQWTIVNYIHQYVFIHKKPPQDPHELTETWTGEALKYVTDYLTIHLES